MDILSYKKLLRRHPRGYAPRQFPEIKRNALLTFISNTDNINYWIDYPIIELNKSIYTIIGIYPEEADKTKSKIIGHK